VVKLACMLICEQMTVLHVMSFIIERMQAEIRPHIDALVRYLPMLWDASVEHGMLRCAIISTLTVLVQVFHSSIFLLCVIVSHKIGFTLDGLTWLVKLR
jgi:hypothetical protein